jgi:serine protease AprX
LLKSEDESSEKKIEEDNWVAAAEFADSVGADVINSSLGYNTFDGGIGDYVYSDFDGRTTVVSQGAVWAHRKGILVVNSMGNEGSSSWQYMLSPADADSILSIGGADGANNHVGFASVGPTFDGRLKPNVSALATGVYVLSGSNTTQPGNGTSFAAPLISGLAACLWQADPTLTNYQVLELIERSSNQHTNPDTLLGYGIPNFALAFNNISIDERSALLNLKIYPVPFGDELTVEGFGENQSEIEVSLTNLNGTSIETKSHFENDKLVIDNLGSLSKGVYILTIISNNKSSSFRVIK